MSNIYEGLCIGGPLAGQRRRCDTTTLVTIEQTGFVPLALSEPNLVTATEVRQTSYFWQPFTMDGGKNFFGFWRHESLKDIKALIDALVNGYHPMTGSREFP